MSDGLVSPNEWLYKDVNTWAFTKAHKGSWKVLFCLHPSLVRLRDSDGSPVILSKPVMIVTQARKEMSSDQYGRDEIRITSSSADALDAQKVTHNAQKVVAADILQEKADSSESSSDSEDNNLEDAYGPKSSRLEERRHQTGSMQLEVPDARRTETWPRGNPEGDIIVREPLLRENRRQRSESRSRSGREQAYSHSLPSSLLNRDWNEASDTALLSSTANRTLPLSHESYVSQHKGEPYLHTIRPEGTAPPISPRRPSVPQTRQLRRESNRGSRSREHSPKRKPEPVGDRTRPNSPTPAANAVGDNFGIYKKFEGFAATAKGLIRSADLAKR